MKMSLVVRTLAWSGAVASCVGLVVTMIVIAGHDHDARVATMILPIAVLASAAAVAITRGSGWFWLFLILEAVLVLLAMASVGILFVPGLVLGLAGAVAARVATRRQEPSRGLLSA